MRPKWAGLGSSVVEPWPNIPKAMDSRPVTGHSTEEEYMVDLRPA